jgi:hypothetical protein
MLQQGLFVADVLYYNGDEVPNFIPPKNIDPSRGFGYDYDVCNSEVLLTRLSVKNGRIVLPDGMSYRLLILPDRPVLPLSVARKIQELIVAGATVIGPKPLRTPGLTGYPKSEQQLKKIADKVWGALATPAKLNRAYGQGRIITGENIREVLIQSGIPADFAYKTSSENSLLDFIHRRTDVAEIYFVNNRRSFAMQADCSFRSGGCQPELWNPVTGEQRELPQFETGNGITTIPLQFEPYGAFFVIFRKKMTKEEGKKSKEEGNFPELIQIQELKGSWTVQFDPRWFYPTTGLDSTQAKGLMVFDVLEDWNKRPEPALKNFSGSAVYRKIFELSSDVKNPKNDKIKDTAETAVLKPRLFLDLGTVKETASIKLNGKELGVVWCAPWRIEITEAAKTGKNELEIKVVNLWTNRLVGDKKLPVAERRTQTRMFVGWLNNDQLPSGLTGHVTIQSTNTMNIK